MKPTLMLACALALCNTATAAEFALTAPSAFPHGSDSGSIAIGDVTGDGRDDLVLATSWYDDPPNDYKVFVYVQQANGTLAAPLRLSYGTSDSFEEMGVGTVALGDLDNNGIKDIVVAHYKGITQMLADGKDGFRTTLIDYAPIPRAQVVDVDRDGILDFVVENNGVFGIRVLYRSAIGTIRSTKTIALPAAAFWQDVKLADLTGDGLPDLLVTENSSLWVSTQTTSHGFKAGVEYRNPNTLGWGYGSMAIGDFNQDGRNDVLVATEANIPNAALWFHPQRPGGTLGEAQRMETADVPHVYGSVDLDRDGLQDLLVNHTGGQLGRYMQGAGGMLAEQFTEGAYGEGGFTTGDLDGDGCTDVASTSLGPINVRFGRNCHEPWSMADRHDGDFDGDGKSDILWHDTATGASTIWKSGSSSTQIAMTRVTDTSWTIAGIGDFNGDGKSDILWHHVITGANAIWNEGLYAKGQTLTTVTDLDWEIVGIGDFDGNGKDDILWRHKYTGANAIWKEGLYAKGQNLTTTTDLDWKVVGVGDFDGNGKADILWRHRADGRNARSWICLEAGAALDLPGSGLRRSGLLAAACSGRTAAGRSVRAYRHRVGLRERNAFGEPGAAATCAEISAAHFNASAQS